MNAVPMIVACAIGQGCNRAPWDDSSLRDEVERRTEVPVRAEVTNLDAPTRPWWAAIVGG